MVWLFIRKEVCFSWHFYIRNDILRAKGILPPKDEKRDDEVEDAFVGMVKAKEAELNSLANKDLDELDELEDLEDDRILNEYR